MIHDVVDVQGDFLGGYYGLHLNIYIVVVDRQVAGYCELITFRQSDVAGVDSCCINRHGHGPLFDLFAIHDVIDIQGDFLGGGFFIQSQVHGRAIYTDVYDKVIAQPSLIPESKGFHSGKAAEELLCFFGRIHNCGQAVGDGMPDIGNPRSSKVSLTAGHQDILIVIFCMQNIILIEVGVFLYQILAKGDVDLLDGVLDLLVLSSKGSAVPVLGNIIFRVGINIVVFAVQPASQLISLIGNNFRETNGIKPIIGNNGLSIVFTFSQLTVLTSIKVYGDQGFKGGCHGINNVIILIEVRNIERIWGSFFIAADFDLVPSSKAILGRIVGHSFNIDKALLSVAVKSLHLSHFAAGNFDLAVCQLRSIFNLSFITSAVAVCHSDLAIFRSLGKDHIFILNELGSQSIAFASSNTFQRIDTIITRYISTLASPAGKEILEVAAIFALYLGGIQSGCTVYNLYSFLRIASDRTLVFIHHIVNRNGGHRSIFINSVEGNRIGTICHFVDLVISERSLITECLGVIGGKHPLIQHLAGGGGDLRSIVNSALIERLYRECLLIHGTILCIKVHSDGFFLIVRLFVVVGVFCPDSIHGLILVHVNFRGEGRNIRRVLRQGSQLVIVQRPAGKQEVAVGRLLV